MIQKDKKKISWYKTQNVFYLRSTISPKYPSIGDKRLTISPQVAAE